MSYSHRDATLVNRVAADLRARAVNVWLDEWNLKPGMSLPDVVHRAIVGSHHALFFISSSFIRSKWCRAELDTAAAASLAGRRKRKLTLIPALVDNCKIPETISRFVYADFRGNYLTGLAKVLEVVAPPVPKTLDHWFLHALSSRDLGDSPDRSKLMREVKRLEAHWNYRFRASAPVSHLQRPTREKPYDFGFDFLVDKWLGNTIRDYVCYRVVFDLRKYLEEDAASSYSTNALLDRLFSIVQSTVHGFGLAQSRRAEETLVELLESLAGHMAPNPGAAQEG